MLITLERIAVKGLSGVGFPRLPWGCPACRSSLKWSLITALSLRQRMLAGEVRAEIKLLKIHKREVGSGSHSRAGGVNMAAASSNGGLGRGGLVAVMEPQGGSTLITSRPHVAKLIFI